MHDVIASVKKNNTFWFNIFSAGSFNFKMPFEIENSSEMQLQLERTIEVEEWFSKIIIVSVKTIRLKDFFNINLWIYSRM